MDKKTEALNTYIWVGKNKGDTKVRGKMRAINANMVQTKLNSAGIHVLKIRKKFEPFSTVLKKRIRFADVVFFSRHLAVMINAGVPLVEALEIIVNGVENVSMQALIQEIGTDVKSGNSLTDALKKHPRYFDNLYCGLIHTGEKSGTLDLMLNRLAAHLEKAQSMKKKVIRACIYPIIVVIIALAVTVLMLLFIVPQFETLFKSHGAELPAFTQVIIGISQYVRSYWFLVITIIVGIVVGFHYLRKKSKQFAAAVDRLILKIPIFGELFRKIIFAQFTRTLAITLNAGVLIVDALELVEGIVKNSVFVDAIAQIRSEVVTGKQMCTAMYATQLFPSMIVQMIEVGEKTGEMKIILEKIADYYEEEVDLTVDNMSTILEPFTIVFLGGIVAVLVIAMYLPIFKLGAVF